MARTRFARSGGVRIAYELRARRWRRRPWLVLVQGLAFDRFGWDPEPAAAAHPGPHAGAAPRLLHGDADAVVDPRNSRLLAQRIPRAELVTLPGLGHLFFWEDPGAFVDAVVTFLAAPDEPA